MFGLVESHHSLGGHGFLGGLTRGTSEVSCSVLRACCACCVLHSVLIYGALGYDQIDVLCYRWTPQLRMLLFSSPTGAQGHWTVSPYCGCDMGLV